MAAARAALCMLLAVALAAAPGRLARAADITVQPGELQDAVAHARRGDVLHLVAGAYSGNVTIDTAGITLEGEPGALIDGAGQGRTIWVRAPDVTLRHLTIVHSGIDLPAMDAGVFLDKPAARARIEDNVFRDN